MLGVAELNARTFEMFGACVLDKAMDLPSPVSYAMSPHKVVANIAPEGTMRVSEIAGAYAREYVALWDRTQPPADTAQRDFCLRKKAALRELMKANDPGRPHMVSAFGKELTDRVFDEVF
jgi:hypothetical protein